jgi:hypothetical protein
MDGPTLQSKIYGGYAKAAQRIGFPCSVYRSASMINPIAIGNRIFTNFYASFAVDFNFAQYNRPHIPDWKAMIDGRVLLHGDWVVGQQGTFYIADLQETLPIAAVQCTRNVSIVRPTYTTTGALEQTETTIASQFPVYGFTSRNKAKAPAGFPTSSETEAGVPGMQFYVNSQIVGAIQKNDVIIDENGLRFVVDSPTFSSFGYIVQTHIEKA